jgi:hypothetical protein
VPVWQADLGRSVLPPGPVAGRLVGARFGARDAWGLADTVAVDRGVLSVLYPEGSINPTQPDRPRGGAGFYTDLAAGAEAACLSYRVRFDPGMAFADGGKLPGLYGGSAPSGGDRATGRNGFSVRLMWRADGVGEVYAYVVNDGGAPYGLSVGRGLFAFQPDRWTDIDLAVRLNTPDARDGRIRLWVDGRPVIDQRGVVFRTDPAVTVDGLMFSTFFGGSSARFASPRDQWAHFADFRIGVLAPAGDG